MIEKVNFNDLPMKALNEIHGEKVLYQLVWRFTPKEKILKAFKGVARLTVRKGETNLMHNHEKEEQIYIILSGSGEIQVGEERALAIAGDVIYLPANVPSHCRVVKEATPAILATGFSEKMGFRAEFPPASEIRP